MQLSFTVLGGTYAVCKVKNHEKLNFEGEFFSLTKAGDELSLVCAQECVDKANVLSCKDGWRIIKVDGVLDFSLVGILKTAAELLANAGVSIFAVSTFDTDYILVDSAMLETAVSALRAGGHKVHRTGEKAKK